MRTLIVLTVWAGFALALTAADDPKPPEGWKEYKGGYKKQAYAVWLPPGGTLDEAESSFVTKQGQVRIFRTVMAAKDGALYAAGQIILPPGLTKAPAKDRQDFLRDLFVDEVKGKKVLEEKKAMLGTMAGKEYLVETPDGLARMRLLGTGVQLFRVIAIGTKEQVQGKEADAFFESFKRTPAENKDTKKDDPKKP